MRARGEVSDADWAVLEPLLRFLQLADMRGRPPADTREVLNGVLWILRTGAQCGLRATTLSTTRAMWRASWRANCVESKRDLRSPSPTAWVRWSKLYLRSRAHGLGADTLYRWLRRF